MSIQFVQYLMSTRKVVWTYRCVLISVYVTIILIVWNWFDLFCVNWIHNLLTNKQFYTICCSLNAIVQLDFHFNHWNSNSVFIIMIVVPSILNKCPYLLLQNKIKVVYNWLFEFVIMSLPLNGHHSVLKLL